MEARTCRGTSRVSARRPARCRARRRRPARTRRTRRESRTPAPCNRACRPWDRSRGRPACRAAPRALRCRPRRSEARNPVPACLLRSLPHANGASHRRIPGPRRDLRLRCARRLGLLPPRRAAWPRHASDRARPDAARRAGRARAAPPQRSPPGAGAPALSLRESLAARRALSLAVRPGRASAPPRVVRRRHTGGRSARRAGVHDRSRMKRFFERMNPTLRGFLIILAVVAIIVVLNLETALISLTLIAKIAFLLAIAFFVFLMWRERRGDIALWPRRA